MSTATSALAFLIRRIVQRVAPGGVLPTHLPSDLSSYLTGPTAAVASGARQAVYAAESAVRRGGFPQVSGRIIPSQNVPETWFNTSVLD